MVRQDKALVADATTVVKNHHAGAGDRQTGNHRCLRRVGTGRSSPFALFAVGGSLLAPLLAASLVDLLAFLLAPPLAPLLATDAIRRWSLFILGHKRRNLWSWNDGNEIF